MKKRPDDWWGYSLIDLFEFISVVMIISLIYGYVREDEWLYLWEVEPSTTDSYIFFMIGLTLIKLISLDNKFRRKVKSDQIKVQDIP